jgi:hypothetical protein
MARRVESRRIQTSMLPPTSAPPFVQEKWSRDSCDRNFNNAWGDSSPLELGRVMPNECWLRSEAPLTKSEADPRTVNETSIEQGPTRRDPRGTLRARGDRTCPALNDNQHHDAPPRWAASWDASRHSRGHAGTQMLPVGTASSVALLGVSAYRVWRMSTERTSHRSIEPTRSQETDGSDRKACGAPLATAGDGCPDGVSYEGCMTQPMR